MLTHAPHPDRTAGHRATAEAVLTLLLPYRRTLDDPQDATPDAFHPQLRRLTPAIAAGAPIRFTLPGFPCKSPNPAKVLGHLPDEGERLALRFLDGLCARIAAVHPPGARIVICSDGHAFSDLIRVPDAHIDAYGDALRTMIRDEGLTHLDLFDLRDVHGDLPYDEQRARLHARYAPSLETLRSGTRGGDEETRRLYQGITRFLFEDTAAFPGTRSALQRDCRTRAYGVIQRSRAWGALIAEHHPRAVRLSIHPQPRGSAKFGMRLLDAPDVWMTPWHSSVLQHPDGRRQLMRRADAERLGRLVLRQGRPSHFEAT
ncbi:L-tyrosine/L-tryptophan isonitrile synthase family protein [Streptomyces chattanoogensis]|uniref:Pyoverdine biosynthesis protein PvcA n=1 Tax=Streptomyces chattanoogensis TaxID=66876 RepID=A0A0N0XQF9_9ACTN|nr:isocyanide synthase family protein [Streptomyces chattanoogensis]KPC58608.1 pyoverdine biosynthesis protein PvcA [Streptomyces chattanoogensis]